MGTVWAPSYAGVASGCLSFLDFVLRISALSFLSLSSSPSPSPLEDSDLLLAGIEAAVGGAAAPAVAPPDPPAPLVAAGLTPREAEVLRLLATGASNREIADALVVSVRTVERHLLHVYGKIGARRRADAVAYALRRGLA